MAQPTIKNRFGVLVGWSKISANLLGRRLEGITEISYSEVDSMEPGYGAGKFVQGLEEGNSTPAATITLFLEESIALQRSVPAGKRLQDIDFFDVTVSYDYNGTIYTDVIRNCKFKNTGRSSSQGDGKITHQYNLYCSHIDYNV